MGLWQGCAGVQQRGLARTETRREELVDAPLETVSSALLFVCFHITMAQYEVCFVAGSQLASRRYLGKFAVLHCQEHSGNNKVAIYFLNPSPKQNRK